MFGCVGCGWGGCVVERREGAGLLFACFGVWCVVWCCVVVENLHRFSVVAFTFVGGCVDRGVVRVKSACVAIGTKVGFPITKQQQTVQSTTEHQNNLIHEAAIEVFDMLRRVELSKDLV